MPNHVLNLITLNGDEKTIEQMRTAFMLNTEETGGLDFEKVIPMPKSLDIEASSQTDFGMKLYLIAAALEIPEEEYAVSGDKIRAILRHTDYMSLNKVDDRTLERDLKIGKIAIQNVKQYGAPDWYDWCIENWGTKWNSYDPQPCDDNQFKFSTAWSAPHPILKKLSECYPEIAISHQWADENLGYNLGYREYLNGEVAFELELDEGSMAAKRFACDLFECCYEVALVEAEDIAEPTMC